MTTFIGFNTIDQPKKFTLTDFALVKRDLLNAFNIRPGELVGRPTYGTNLWDYVFDNESSIKIKGNYVHRHRDGFEYYSINNWSIDRG